MKKPNLKEYEDDFIKSAKEKTTERTKHAVNEMAQEKMFLEELYKRLERHEVKSQEILDASSHEKREGIKLILQNPPPALHIHFIAIPFYFFPIIKSTL